MPFLDEIDDSDQLESAADRLAFLDVEAFGTAAQWVTSAGVAAGLAVIFNVPTSEEAGVATVGITSGDPSALCRQADVPAGGAQGDHLFIEGAWWRVRDLRPDQTGFVILDLQRL